ncbi:MAG TPA: HAMP domain-containing sensor histidine kinase [Geothrix sp.]|nr:HAMP domain-containing sensor histidine kinase [Geothrix sp.]
MVLLLAGNAILPLFYGKHLLAIVLDYLGVFTLAFWAAGLAWRRARREGPAAFGLLGLGAALGGLHYAPTLLRLPYAALAGPAISILGLLALGAGFLRWPQQIRMARDRMRTSLDGLAIALAVFTAAWVAMGPMEGVGSLSRGRLIIYLAQISAVLGLLTLWLLQETRLMLPEQARAKALVKGALVALLAHSALAALLRVTGHYHGGYLGHGVEVLHQVASLLLALAALSPASTVEPPLPRKAPSPLRALLPSLVSLGVLFLAAFHLLRPHTDPQRALMGLSLGLLSVLMLRHGLLILDLERLSHDLEIRVEERTRKLEDHHREAMSGLRMRIMAGLAAGLAHDLNNLLGIIRLRVDLLDEDCTPEQKKHLSVLAETSERAVAMTQRILASSRMQEAHPSAFDFTAWMKERSGLFQALLGPRQRLDLQVAPGLHAFADPHSLDQILQNLVSNARDAMGPEGLLLLRAEARAETLRVEVRDDGPGIPAGHQAQMFEPFFTTKAQGTGLGLATVRNLVLQNRGSIQVESEPGRGTAFIIDLPVPERLLLA